jgi:lysophospholipase L1-like esterase
MPDEVAPSRRRRRFRCSALAGTLLLAGLVGEVLLATLAPQPVYRNLIAHTPACYRASDRTPFLLLPGAQTEFRYPEFHCQVSINQLGLRMDREVSPEPSPGVARVAVVGDSFTFGWGVTASEAWPEALSRAGERQGVPVEGLNLGFALGFSPDAYYAGLRAAPIVSADVLVVGLYVANDLTVVGLGTEWTELDSEGLPLRVQSPTTRVDEYHRWRLRDTLLRYRVPGWRDSHLLIGLSRLAGRSRDPIAGKEASALRKMFSWELYREPWPRWIESSFQSSVRCLIGLRDVAEARGQRYLVVVIPTTEQVYEVRMLQQPDGRTLEARSFRQAPGDEVPQRRLRAALGAAGVEVLDLLPGLIQARRPALYFNHDNHWTADGHRVVADLLLQDLLRRGWLEASEPAASPR